MNVVIISGRVTKEIELKETAQGTHYCRFTLAVNRKDSNGTQRTEFPAIIAWGKLSETIAKYVSKGTLICVNGRIQTSNYESNGQKRYETSIVAEKFEFMESRRKEEKQDDLVPLDGFEEIDFELPY